jgi:hypothetical protein
MASLFRHLQGWQTESATFRSRSHHQGKARSIRVHVDLWPVMARPASARRFVYSPSTLFAMHYPRDFDRKRSMDLMDAAQCQHERTIVPGRPPGPAPPSCMASGRVVALAELAEYTSATDCWLAIEGCVYVSHHAARRAHRDTVSHCAATAPLPAALRRKAGAF